MNSEINIEKIMEEIRQEIKDRGFIESTLRFDDIPLSYSDMGTDSEEFNRDEFQKSLDYINLNWDVPYYFNIGTNKIIVFVKRIIRKLVKFLVWPINQKQNEMNANFVRSINQIRNYIDNEASTKNQVDNLEYIFNRQVKKDFVKIQETFSCQRENDIDTNKKMSELHEQLQSLKHENLVLREQMEIVLLKCEKLEYTCEILRGN